MPEANSVEEEDSSKGGHRANPGGKGGSGVEGDPRGSGSEGVRRTRARGYS